MDETHTDVEQALLAPSVAKVKRLVQLAHGKACSESSEKLKG